MILNELFSGNSQVEELDPENYEGFDELDLGKLAACYLLPYNGADYIFFFEDYRDSTEFVYGKVILKNGNKKLDYNLTSEGTPIPVLNAVVTVLLNFIQKYDPITVHFVGYNNRQTRFYRSFVRYLGKKLPKPFYFSEKGSDFYATRDERYENYRIN